MNNMKSIQQYRAELGISVKELRELAGWSQSTYDRISRGERSLSPLEIMGLESMPKKRGRKKGY